MSLEHEAFAGRPVTVMGLGLFGGGAATARYFAHAGARVTVTDLRDEDVLAPAIRDLAGLELRFVLGRHRERDFTNAALVVRNPAVPADSPYLQLARDAGVPVTSEAELVLDRAPARLVLVTGTQGKSSTCHFLAQLLESAFSGRPLDGRPNVLLGGNIGAPLLERTGEMRANDVCVMELSSYQLEALEHVAPRPNVAAVCVTNVSQDHLERHGDEDAYFEVKARVIALAPPAAAVFHPADDRRFVPHVAAAARAGRAVPCGPAATGEAALTIVDGAFRRGRESLGRVADLPLPGAFNRANALVALGLARELGAAPEALAAALPDLRGLPHRMQDLGAFDGVRVVDNGVATIPDATLAALEALAEDGTGPLTLLVGGELKRGLSFEPLAAAAAAAGATVVTFGAGAEILAETFGAAGATTRSARALGAAVALAFEATPRGGTLLFSPAAASFDQYANFRARADAFRIALASRSVTHRP